MASTEKSRAAAMWQKFDDMYDGDKHDVLVELLEQILDHQGCLADNPAGRALLKVIDMHGLLPCMYCQPSHTGDCVDLKEQDDENRKVFP